MAPNRINLRVLVASTVPNFLQIDKRFGGIHCPEPYKSISFGGVHGPNTYKLIGLGGIHGPKPYKSTSLGGLHGPKRSELQIRWHPWPEPFKFANFGASTAPNPVTF